MMLKRNLKIILYNYKFKENNMIVISLTFFDEDSGVVKNDIIPCTSIDIAKNISLKLHKEHSFYFCKIERDKHEKCTEWDENGGWTVDFGDGYMKCKIYDTEEINEKNVHTFNYDWSKVSLPWSKWYECINYNNYNMEKHYKWNKESFLKFIEDSKANVEIINNQIENTVLLHVKDYNTMNMLFYGKANWGITSSKAQWDNYTNDGKRKQYVWVNFNVKETEKDALIGFTVVVKPDEKYIYAAYDAKDYIVSSVIMGHTIETLKQGVINKGINIKEIL